uniref:Uncharacterized protein n=1 Tax=Glossina austeni TaxID=7395 RepID=A0A1A9UIW4_GLOAU
MRKSLRKFAALSLHGRIGKLEKKLTKDKDMLFQVVPASANLPPYIRPYVPSLIRCSDSKVPGCTLGMRRIFSLGSPELPPAVLAPPNILPLPRLDFDSTTAIWTIYLCEATNC